MLPKGRTSSIPDISHATALGREEWPPDNNLLDPVISGIIPPPPRGLSASGLDCENMELEDSLINCVEVSSHEIAGPSGQVEGIALSLNDTNSHH